MKDCKAEDYAANNPSLDPVPYVSDGFAPTHPASGVVSFLSNTERQGPWELPRQFRALSVLGNVELDLRDAEIGFGLSVIEAVTVLGNIELTIPPHITVECDGDSLMGSFSLKYGTKTSPAQASRDRVIRITGTAYLGSVTINVKGPDERMLDRLARTFGMERHS